MELRVRRRVSRSSITKYNTLEPSARKSTHTNAGNPILEQNTSELV